LCLLSVTALSGEEGQGLEGLDTSLDAAASLDEGGVRYLMIQLAGGLNQMRAGVCDAVVVAYSHASRPGAPVSGQHLLVGRRQVSQHWVLPSASWEKSLQLTAFPRTTVCHWCGL